MWLLRKLLPSSQLFPNFSIPLSISTTLIPGNMRTTVPTTSQRNLETLNQEMGHVRVRSAVTSIRSSYQQFME